MKSTQAILVILIILVIDQWSKFYVKTHFALHDSVEVFSWFKIYFIENEGLLSMKKCKMHNLPKQSCICSTLLNLLN